MKKIGLIHYVNDFNVGYHDTEVDDILDIHNYLKKKNDILKVFRFIKNCFFIAMMFLIVIYQIKIY